MVLGGILLILVIWEYVGDSRDFKVIFWSQKKNLFFWLKFPNYQKLYKYSKTQKMIPLKLQKELKCTVGVKNFPKP